MALKRREIVKRKNKGLRLDTQVLAELDDYQKWLVGYPTLLIVEDAIRDAIKANKEYQEFKNGANKPLTERKPKAAALGA